MAVAAHECWNRWGLGTNKIHSPTIPLFKERQAFIFLLKCSYLTLSSFCVDKNNLKKEAVPSCDLWLNTLLHLEEIQFSLGLGEDSDSVRLACVPYCLRVDCTDDCFH
jgi:hypothetical protein